MSKFAKYGTRNDEEDPAEDSDPLLTEAYKYSPAQSTVAPVKRFHPYTIVGVASAVIVSLILIVAVTMDNTSSSMSHKTAAAVVDSTAPGEIDTTTTSYHKGAKVSELSKLKESAQRLLFGEFKKKFNVKYESKDEEESRFKKFQQFLSHVDLRNGKEAEKNGKANHGITRFADMTQEEFKKGYLTYKRNDNEDARKLLLPSPVVGKTKSTKSTKETSTKTSDTSTATSIDWTGIYTTSVKDQGYCGSCWAFSAAEQLESDAIREGLLTTAVTLSPQQIVSCDSVDWGCNGGDTVTAYAYVYSAGGITSEAQYPYISYWGTTFDCKLGKDSLLVKPTAFFQLKDETALETYVLNTGPVSVCVDASDWASYTSGIVTTCGMEVNHCVQVVGVNTEAGYWKIRNSWGTSWGDRGYIYLQTGSNMCNIVSEATYVTVVKAQ